ARARAGDRRAGWLRCRGDRCADRCSGTRLAAVARARSAASSGLRRRPAPWRASSTGRRNAPRDCSAYLTDLCRDLIFLSICFRIASGSVPTKGATAVRTRPLILVSLLLAAFVINLDTTIVNVALPTLVRELHASTSQLQWVVDAYNLVFAALL